MCSRETLETKQAHIHKQKKTQQLEANLCEQLQQLKLKWFAGGWNVDDDDGSV